MNLLLKKDIVRYYSGNYCDVLVGRMSAENVAHVQTQVQRSIWYEQEITTADTWLNSALGIADLQGAGQGHDGGEADYVHMNNIRTRLLNYGYSTVHQEYCGVGSGTSPAQISSRFNSGISMTNYINHGNETGWGFDAGCAGYTNTQVNALQNSGKLSYIFSVACLCGRFNWTNGPCFAETWMRATQGGQPTGAIGTFMAIKSIGWIPGMTAQDVFANICIDLPNPYGGVEPGVKRTLAGTCLNATQKMLMVHGVNGPHGSNECLTDYLSWTVFGDPTLTIRTKTPQEMTISHLPNIPLGASEFTVECDANGAVAAITYKDASNEVIILGVATVVDGVATVVFDAPLAVEGELTLAVTGFNKVAYLTTLEVGTVELFPPKNLIYSIEKANHVILNWDAPKGKILTVTGYNVYRGGEVITPEPVSELTFTDIANANGTYEYYITALYGASLESDPCEPVTVTINGMCVPISKSISVEQTEGANIRVSWEAPAYEGTELAGYNLYRGDEKMNTEIIPAATLSFLDENVETDVELCYYVEVVYNDCGETLKTGKVCKTILSVRELPGQEFSIYPNPTCGEFTIDNGQLTINNVEIYDVYGRKVETRRAASLQAEIVINISHLQSGIYFVKIYSEANQIAIKKLIINK